MPPQFHRSDPRILGRRTLQRDHRCLAELLRPGLAVLDVGCGTGAITAGIARAVGPRGSVVGIDRDEGLIELARREHASVPNLRFEAGDATALRFRAEFDVVTAARTLQWIGEPARAVGQMKLAVKPGGVLVILDFNHPRHRWVPEPPHEFQLFYNAFLAWRQANGWNDEIADRLPELFRSAGLADIRSSAQDEVVKRGDPDFDERASLWSEVVESLGAQLAAAGFCTMSQLEEARDRYRSWVSGELVQQTLAMSATIGVAG